MIRVCKRERLLASTGVSLLVALAASGVAYAQEAAPSGQEEAASVEEIVVTGSRIARKDYVANSPIVTVGQEDFQDTGSVTVDTLLNDMPQFVPSINFTSNNPSNGGQANINLRGLGTPRTLVLMNGRRVIPSNSTGVVDVNIIPTALIKNIEVISGGASATYGSDALAGVTNFILRDDFEGVQVDAQYGETERGDGRTESYSVTVGGNFADDRGNAVMSMGYSTREPIYNVARDFSAISGPSGSSPLGSTLFDSTNLPNQTFVNTYFGQTVGNGGQFGFNNDGSLFSYTKTLNFDSPGGIDFDGFSKPGVGDWNYNTGPLNLLALPLERYQAFASGTYDINDHVEFYGNALFTQYESRNTLAPTPAANNVPGTGFRVPSTNPFISSELRSFLNARPNPNGSFLLNKRFNSLGGRTGSENYTVYQFTTGLRGDLPVKDWTYDVYAQYGRVDQVTTQTGNVSRSAVQTLLDAADGGASICAGGFDPFGETTLSAACATYIGRTSKNTTNYSQQNLEATIQGGLFDLPAGEVRFAAGVAQREDSFAFVPDAMLAQRNAVVTRPDGGQNGGSEIAGFNPQQALSGTVQVREIFAETLIPVLRDLPLIQELNVNLGIRKSDYTTVGDVLSWKADGDWLITDGLRVRGGFQHATRAPSIGELYAPSNTSFPSIGAPRTTAGVPQLFGDPCDIRGAYRTGPNAAQVRALCLAQGINPAVIDTYTFSNNQVSGLTGGNPDLKEETADTYTVGVVYQPHFSMPLFERMSASVDYYNIEISDVIGTIAASDQLRGCFNAQGDNPTYSASNGYCQLFRRDSLTGNVVEALELNGNLATLMTSGVDAQFDWSFDLVDTGVLPDAGSIDFKVVVGWLENWQRQNAPGGQFTTRTGTIDSTFGNTFPEWKLFSSVDYNIGDYSVGARFRRVGEFTQFGTKTVLEPVNYWDLNASWDVNEALALRAGVNNVTDAEPQTYSPGIQANTDPSTYDVLGRRFYVGLTAKF